MPPRPPPARRRPSLSLRGKELWLSVLWAWVYVVVVAAPLALVATAAPAGRDLRAELGAACGFLALSVMAGQFAMTARFKWLEPPLGTDLVYAFHRYVTWVGVLFLMVHPVLLVGWRPSDVWPWLDPGQGGWAGTAGGLSVLFLTALIGSSVWRKAARIHYDLWRKAHGALALVAVLLAVWHALALGSSLAPERPRMLWIVYTAAWVALIFRVRLLKPWKLSRRPWVVESVKKQRGFAVALALRPRGHHDLRFKAGQFAWITAGDSPYSAREHPFSFSGDATRTDRLEFTIKEAGDWTRRVQSLKPGETVYVDGPFGTLCPDRYPRAAGYGMVAGGIGIAPFMSHLRTMASRRERRPILLVYGSNHWEHVTYREELEELKAHLPQLKIVHVLLDPPSRWKGERGFVRAEIFERHAPAAREWEWFVCGPPKMMEATERALLDVGVPLGRIHAEIFDMV